jgi:hypothetical protein
LGTDEEVLGCSKDSGLFWLHYFLHASFGLKLDAVDIGLIFQCGCENYPFSVFDMDIFSQLCSLLTAIFLSILIEQKQTWI